MATVADVVDWSERAFPARLAESWDAVGLVCGRPEATVDGVLVCVDVTEPVIDQAEATGASLILAHHPLLLSAVNSVAATDNRGRILHRLMEAGCALLTAHTNADSADPGVSDALAAVLGVIDLQPLAGLPRDDMDKLVVFVPREHANALLDALAAAGAGTVGHYERCAYQTEGLGTFRPTGQAKPTIGRLGQIETVPETRLEMVLPRGRRADVVTALRAAHPYEEPAFDLVEICPTSATEGLGRVGHLPQPTSLGSFSERVAAALPATPQGLRVLGNLDEKIHRVAVCGGSGDSLLAAADASCADVFVTADLKHHRVLDHAHDGRASLVDVAHWASEYPWLWQVADQLTAAFELEGEKLNADVCTLRTDPWTAALRSGA